MAPQHILITLGKFLWGRIWMVGLAGFLAGSLLGSWVSHKAIHRGLVGLESRMDAIEGRLSLAKPLPPKRGK
jgi:hypothetical protein